MNFNDVMRNLGGFPRKRLDIVPTFIDSIHRKIAYRDFYKGELKDLKTKEKQKNITLVTLIDASRILSLNDEISQLENKIKETEWIPLLYNYPDYTYFSSRDTRIMNKNFFGLSSRLLVVLFKLESGVSLKYEVYNAKNEPQDFDDKDIVSISIKGKDTLMAKMKNLKFEGFKIIDENNNFINIPKNIKIIKDLPVHSVKTYEELTNLIKEVSKLATQFETPIKTE
jgi:hypothetical protein